MYTVWQTLKEPKMKKEVVQTSENWLKKKNKKKKTLPIVRCLLSAADRLKTSGWLPVSGL